MKRTSLKRLTSLLLAAVMAFSVTPAALAAEGDELAPDSNNVIKLTADVTTAQRVLTVESGKTVTLDLNGHNISSSYDPYTISVEAGGTLTIIGKGTITNTSAGSTTIRNYGNLTIGAAGAGDADSPTVTRVTTTNGAGNSAVKNEEGSNLTIYSGTFIGDKRSVQSWGITNIYGGTFEKTVEAWKWPDYSSELNISGGIFKNEVKVGKDNTYRDDATIAITGGTFKTDVSGYVPDGYIYNPLSGEVVQGGDGAVAAVDVLPSSKQTLEVDSTTTLQAYITPTTAAATNPVTWHCDAGKESVITVDQTGKVTAVGPGEAEVWAEAGGVPSDKVSFEVSGVVLSETSRTVVVGQSVTLVGKPYGSARDQLETWTSSNISVASVKNGKVNTFNPGKTTITYQSGSYTATCDIVVEENLVNAILRNMTAGEVLSFDGYILQQMRYLCTSGALDYVSNLSVSTSAGILYYGYISTDAPGSGVAGGEKYYVSPTGAQKGIADISFVPKSDFDGTAVITYTGYSGTGSFNGTIRVTVKNSGDVTYSTAEERLLPFDTADFSIVCANRTGSNLRYVTFTLPAASKGTLYYNYSTTGQYSQKVSAGTQYHISGSSLLLENVSFLPADGFTGTVSIPYTGVNSSGVSYSGTVTISVFSTDGGENGSDVADIVYDWANTVSFAVSDFNTVCRNAMGANLSYVSFELPKPEQGKLYYNSAGAVSASDRYYGSTYPYLSGVSFVPATGEAVVISYTGYTVTGRQFTGKVKIVSGGAADGDVTYTTTVGRSVTFNGADFNEACYAATGFGLNYLSFTLPGSDKGALYYYYSYYGSTGGYQMNATGSYNTSSLSSVTFVPASGYTGTVTIAFSGVNTNYESFTGKVKIVVGENTSNTITYTGSSLPIVFKAADFRQVCASALPKTLSYITFDSLPSSVYGRVLVCDVIPGIGTEAQVGVKYHNIGIPSIDTLCFVAKAGYTGTVAIPYTAVDTDGNSVSGRVWIYISDSYLDGYFTDLGSHGWAAPSIEYLYAVGVTGGYGDGRYGPGDSITRGQFVTMLVRLFDFENKYTANFPDVASGSYYYQAVMTAKALGIVTGDGTKFYPNSYLTRQEAVVMIQRAMTAAGKSVTSASTTLLNGYRDGGQVASYAGSAMASMISMGVIGSGGGDLNPTKNITRAEMAVMLHRVATL